MSCMDWRLNNIIDEEADDDTIILRNAGANILSLKFSIREILNSNNITEIKLLTHTDCGAMKLVYNAIKNTQQVSKIIKENLVLQFEDKNFQNINELEEINERLQFETLKSISKDITIIPKLIDLSRYNFSNKNDKHDLAFTLPNKINYKNLCTKINFDEHETYFIHSINFDEVKHDMEIATTYLNIKDFSFLALNNSEYRAINNIVKIAKLNSFMKNNKINIIKM
ncbi:MAG: hypothetical protein ACP5UN_02110 [Candidatus Micrarchaeia archaeon]